MNARNSAASTERIADNRATVITEVMEAPQLAERSTQRIAQGPVQKVPGELSYYYFTTVVIYLLAGAYHDFASSCWVWYYDFGWYASRIKLSSLKIR